MTAVSFIILNYSFDYSILILTILRGKASLGPLYGGKNTPKCPRNLFEKNGACSSDTSDLSRQKNAAASSTISS
jgi:hypothetical protein